MKTFKGFLQEAGSSMANLGEDYKEFANLVKKDCAKYIEATSPFANNNQLFRGMNTVPITFGKKGIRKDRRPSDTSGHAHETLDEFFGEMFNFNYRSGALFASPDVKESKRYGRSFRIFPAGDYMLCGSKNVTDLYAELTDTARRSIYRLSTARNYLNGGEFAEYESYASSPSSLKPGDIEKIKKLNFKIFAGMKYFESEYPSDFNKSEVMIYADSFYFMSAVGLGNAAYLEDAALDLIYK